MAAAVFQVYNKPPPLYRLARAFRRLSLLVLVLLILFTASVAYSAVETARSSSQLSGVSAAFGSNGTIILSSTLHLNNYGFYPVEDLTLVVRVTNTTGVFLGAATIGPTTLPNQASSYYPLTLYVPISATGPGPSLLTQDQTLPVRVWGNATFGYLFPIALRFADNRSWGAPFANLQLSVGAPTLLGGTWSVPVTLSFADHAPLSDSGVLNFVVLSAGGTACGSGSFTMDVPPHTPYSQTTNVPLASGCSPAGGEVTSTFVTPGYTLVLPPEPIP
ncbi:MAG TPA: hypothetical protein VK424_04240 [Thermoplasmata archaeon]|nr:hypothetical protein [Thermoplasmata archaeon]